MFDGNAMYVIAVVERSRAAGKSRDELTYGAAIECGG